jgi:hypothetical protein
MSDSPVFSVLLPAKGRPHLVRDALVSVLDQSFSDFEVIVSNNGADVAVRAAIADRLADPRVRYLEQPIVLSMPEHWERISRLARGRYLTVLSDRSVLKQGALATIAELHARGGSGAEIVTWSWDLYFDELRLFQPLVRGASHVLVLDSDEFALDAQKLHNRYPAAAPRGLNSSVARSIVEEIRRAAGSAFVPLSPDLSFAYACLLTQPKFVHTTAALFISQGLTVSTGGNAYVTDCTSYLRELGVDRPVRYSPIVALLSESLIADDFMAACHRFGRLDLLDRMDRADLYLKCLAELDEKRAAALLPPARIDELANAVDAALRQEAVDVQSRVQLVRSRSIGLPTRVRHAARRLLGTRAERLRPLLVRLRGGRHFESALLAAGHRAR